MLRTLGCRAQGIGPTGGLARIINDSHAVGGFIQNEAGDANPVARGIGAKNIGGIGMRAGDITRQRGHSARKREEGSGDGVFTELHSVYFLFGHDN